MGRTASPTGALLYSEEIGAEQRAGWSRAGKLIVGVLLLVLVGIAAAAFSDGRGDIALVVLSIPLIMWGMLRGVRAITGEGSGLVYEVRDDGIYYRRANRKTFAVTPFEAVSGVRASTDMEDLLGIDDIIQDERDAIERARESGRPARANPKTYGYGRSGMHYDVAGAVRVERPDDADLVLVSDRPTEFADAIREGMT